MVKWNHYYLKLKQKRKKNENIDKSKQLEIELVKIKNSIKPDTECFERVKKLHLLIKIHMKR